MIINDNVSDRQPLRYLDENSKRYASTPKVVLGIVDRNFVCRSGSQDVKLTPIKLPLHNTFPQKGETK